MGPAIGPAEPVSPISYTSDKDNWNIIQIHLSTPILYGMFLVEFYIEILVNPRETWQ